MFTEADPTTLPAGASPRSVNTDYTIGSVGIRPGLESSFYYTDFFSEKNAGFGQSVADGANETPWNSPNNIIHDTLGVVATIRLNLDLPSGSSLDQAITANQTDTLGSITWGPFTSKQANEFVISELATTTPSAIAPNGSTIGGVNFLWQTALPATATSLTGIYTAGTGATVASMSLITSDGNAPAIAQHANTTSIGSLAFGSPVPSTHGIIVAIGAGNHTGSPTFQITDDKGNNYQQIAFSVGAGGNDPYIAGLWLCQSPQGNPTTITATLLTGTVSSYLNFTILDVSNLLSASPAFDVATSQVSTVNVTSFSVGPLTVSGTDEWAVFGISSSTVTMGAGWSAIGAVQQFQQSLGSNTSITASGTFSSSTYAAVLATFKTNGATPAVSNINATSGLGPFTSVAPLAFGSPNTGGNTIIAQCRLLGPINPGVSPNISDSNGNIYALVSLARESTTREIYLWVAQNIAAGANTVTLAQPGGFASSGDLQIFEVSGLFSGGVTTASSELLEALNYPFSLPSTVNILGFQAEITGSQTDASSDSILTISLLQPYGTDPESFSFQLPASNGTVTVGVPFTKWGFPSLTPSQFNNQNFGFKIKVSASHDATFSIQAVKAKVWLTPDPPPSINYLKTFKETGGEILNLFLGSDGVMYQEDAINAPNALTGVYTAIEPNSFAQSCTQSDREFIAISDLTKGTDIPYTYVPPFFDRLSQVGPGAAPTCTTTSSGSSILSITQHGPVTLPTGDHDWILISDSPADHGTFGTPATPGNVFTFVPRSAFIVPDYIKPGTSIVVQGLPLLNGHQVNNDPTGVTAPKFYTVTSVGQPPAGEPGYDAITFTVPFTTFFNAKITAGVTIQSTLSTLTTAAQVPNLEVGNNFQISGTGGAPPAGYDSTWTVLQTPNASELQITSTVLSNNTATYGFNLIGGTAPVVGQSVTVTQTLNGNGLFNVKNAVITATTPGSFSVNLTSGNISSAAENGAGIIFGTIFVFDAFTIIPNFSGAGGQIVTSGSIAAGRRKCCFSFLTRNGYITQPSPTVEFDIPSGASAIAVANLAIGPSNVIARIVHFTPAEGSNFYNIPEPIKITDAATGVDVTNTSTWVLDNITTNAIFSFSDQALLGAGAFTQIDIQGNNLFETAELGSSIGLIPYAGRIFAIGEQNKVTNFINWSFDGGIGVIQSTQGAGGGAGTVTTYPLGWTIDPTNGSGGSVSSSPIFGNAYVITNTTGSTQTVYGMITQGAALDEFGVAIIQASTTYSVRVTAAVPTGPTTGQLVVDLFDTATSRAVGTYTLNLATLGTTSLINIGTLLTTKLAPVPTTLLLRLYATNILNGVTIKTDRIEVFPTEQPNLDTQVTGSYQNNFEAFDQITGVIDGAVQNQQPIKSAFVLFDVLYLVKTHSLLAIRNVDGLEPNQWGTPRVISNAVGTPSIYGVTTGIDVPNAGEEWSIIAGQPGAFIFTGGEPIKLTEEIQSLWNQINWKYGHTLWVQNDVINRRIMIGVPLKTLDDKGRAFTWLPSGIIADTANPTTPNVVLELSYKQLASASALAERVGVHPSYSGRLIASDYTRKWAIWTIQAPAAAFLERSDTTQPLFLGNSANNGKVFSIVDGLLEDDGLAIDQRYCTYGFPGQEQEANLQLGPVAKHFVMMLLKVDGTGSLNMKAYPNTLDTPYVSELLPDLPLPSSIDGDTEVPLDERGNRLFLEFRSHAIDSGFEISKMALSMVKDVYLPTRGVN